MSPEETNEEASVVPEQGSEPVTAEAPTPTPDVSAAPLPPTPVQTSISTYRAAAQQKIQANKRTKLEKIVAFAQKKRAITNDDVEKLLRVSDATATRYLSQLVREGRLKRVGKPEIAEYELV